MNAKQNTENCFHAEHRGYDYGFRTGLKVGLFSGCVSTILVVILCSVFGV